MKWKRGPIKAEDLFAMVANGTISDGALTMFLFLASHENRDLPTRNQIAERLCLTKQQVNARLDQLVASGLVTPTDDPDFRTKWVRFDGAFTVVSRAHTRDARNAHPAGHTRDAHGSAPARAHHSVSTDVETASKRSTSDKPTSDDDFDSLPKKPKRGAFVASPEARAIVDAIWEGDRKPVTPYVAVLRIVQDVLDAGYSADEVLAVIPSMPVFSRNAFDFALRKGSTPNGHITAVKVYKHTPTEGIDFVDWGEREHG